MRLFEGWEGGLRIVSLNEEQTKALNKGGLRIRCYTQEGNRKRIFETNNKANGRKQNTHL